MAGAQSSHRQPYTANTFLIYLRARQQIVHRAVDRLAGSLTAATATLRRLLKARSEAVRLGAARSIIELHAKVTGTIKFVDRGGSGRYVVVEPAEQA